MLAPPCASRWSTLYGLDTLIVTWQRHKNMPRTLFLWPSDHKDLSFVGVRGGVPCTDKKIPNVTSICLSLSFSKES